MMLATGNTTASALSGASLGIALFAVAISLVSLYRSHLAPFKVITTAGTLRLRIYPIKNGDRSWYIASADVSLQAVNSGARLGRILLYRLHVSYPSLPIPNAHEIFEAKFVVNPATFSAAGHDRFEWLQEAVIDEWKPFSILPKAAVDQHVVFETRWDEPVVARMVRLTLQQRRDGQKNWANVESWELPLNDEVFADLARGASYGALAVDAIPDKSSPDVHPADLHRYLKPAGPLPGPDPLDKGSRLAYLDDEEHGH